MDIQPQPPLMNRDLRVTHLPPIEVTTWDPQNWNGGWEGGSSTASWERLWNFALTYDGYAYFGGSLNLLGAFANALREEFGSTGRMPELDLRLLRAALFFEQRAACKWTHVELLRCPPELAAYLQALLVAIRDRIS